MDENESNEKVSENYAVQSPALGLPPGSGIAAASGTVDRVRVYAYGPDQVESTEVESLAAARAWHSELPNRWIAVEGGSHPEFLREAGEVFNIPMLVLEDVATLRTWPKVEFLEEHTFVVARLLTYDTSMTSEQLSLVIGDSYVISFHENDSKRFNSIRKRIKNPYGWLRKLGADYLAYTLLDITVDANFLTLEAIGNQLDELESVVFDNVNQPQSEALHRTRHDLLLARRAMRPMREVINQLIRSPESPVQEETKAFYRDCYDHCVEALEFVETYRELLSSLVEIYMTAASNRTNDIMRVLTLVSSIFIPLGFVAGLYGMNFDQSVSPYNMPELRLPFGYPLVIGMMMSIAIGLLIFFYRKGWLSSGDDL